jgi:hypothetical protein
MSDPNYETIRASLLQHAVGEEDGTEKLTNIIKQIELINKAEAAQKEPETPEPKGAKAWFEKHSDALIKVGGTLSTVVLVGFVESKFDVIFRSKASKYL